MEEEKKKWEGKRIVGNLFKWEASDWQWVLITILILTAGFLYYNETKVAHNVYKNLSHTCEVYNQIKISAIRNSSLEEVNLDDIANLTIQNINHG